MNQVKGRGNDQDEHQRDKQIEVAFGARVDAAGLRGGFLFDLVVLHQKPRHGRAEGLLPGFERHPDQIPSLPFLPGPRQQEKAVQRVPELCDGPREVISRAGSALQRRVLRLLRHGVFEIDPDALKLPLPGRQRIGFVPFQHVAHGKSQRVEAVLNAQQEQGIDAIAVDGPRLQHLEAFELQDGVARVHRDGRQGDGQAAEQPGGWRSPVTHS